MAIYCKAARKSLFLLLFLFFSISLVGCGKSLVEKLQDSDPEVRQEAARELGELRDASAVVPLISSLRVSDPIRFGATIDAHMAAEEALRQIGEPAVGPLIEVLGDPDSAVSSGAANVLEQIGGPAVESLIASLGSTDLLVRKKSARILGHVKDARAVEPLIMSLSDPDPAVKEEVWSALRNIGPPAEEALIAALGNQNPDIRERAFQILGDFAPGNSRAREALLAILGSGDPEMRGRAVRALENSASNPDVERALLAALSDSSTAGSAAEALVCHSNVKGKDPTLIPILIEVLNKYGNEYLVQKFYDCGNAQIKDAVSAWAVSHGYQWITEIKPAPNPSQYPYP